MNRRHFIQSLGLLGTSLLPIGHSAWAAISATPSITQKKLVVIFLRGAVDGLSIVVPHDDPNYYRHRSSIAIPRPGAEGGAINLDNYFGLHPALSPLYPLWEQRKLAFVHASGSPDTTRSHFDAQDYMESGTPGRKSTADGWMNRLLLELPGQSSPTRAISMGPVTPRILSGKGSVSSIPTGNGRNHSVLDRPMINDAFSKLYQGDNKLSQAYREGQKTRNEVMGSMEQEMLTANGGAPLPNGFPQDAARLATLMRRDPNIQIAFMALGGWDTHVNQGSSKGQLSNRLEPLGQGLMTFIQHLDTIFQDTTIVVLSEFGRTVKQNGNNGTDHGHGNVMWVLGGNVMGGKVYGDWQGLEERNLYEGRDVPVTTDFRSIFVQAAERHLGLSDPQLIKLFPDMPRRQSPFRIFV